MSRIADIAAALPGYDAADLSVDAVHAFLAQLTAPCVVTQRENVALFDALGRVLAEDIVSPLSVPPHDNSAMDGYAFDGTVLRDDALSDASVTVRVVGTALAGAAWRGAFRRMWCAAATTAALPAKTSCRASLRCAGASACRRPRWAWSRAWACPA
jgi:molybdopterin biosynthesis enzyme